MKSQYLVDISTFELPEIDAQISQYVEEEGEHPWGSTNFFIGIYFNGSLYRRLTAEGLTEWVGCDNFLFSLGLTKIESTRGYDSLFETPA
ncbi:hypothetical protein BKG93_11250 [Rodentibacter ratti]|uniref:Uncharacterized protein n=1 Tax=Rodentibacter ratti TaxID=1906745 RepID=A0A1V3KXX5_9PAST|nr:hypothetical protein [Rodentibacter ratti]OOF82509.1 hypothetical protein BKG93_11250 [Rodentibacter ratti]